MDGCGDKELCMYLSQQVYMQKLNQPIFASEATATFFLLQWSI